MVVLSGDDPRPTQSASSSRCGAGASHSVVLRLCASKVRESSVGFETYFMEQM